MNQTSRVATEPDKPVTGFPYSREGRSPPRSVGSGTGNGTGARDEAQRREQRPSRAGLSTPAEDRQQRGPRGGRGAGCKAGSPGCGSRPPTLSQQRRARQAHTHHPHARPKVSASPLPERHTPVPTGAPHPKLARTRPSGRRSIRTQQHAEHIKGHVRQPRLVKHCLGPGGPTRAVDEAHNSRHRAGGWRRPQATAPLGRRRAAEGRRGPGGSLTASNGARDPCPRSSHTPRRSRASRGCSVVSGPPR